MKAEPFSDTRCDCCERVQHFIRRDPPKTIGLALLGGILLTARPGRQVLSSMVHVLLALVQPVLLILGIAKLCESLDRKS